MHYPVCREEALGLASRLAPAHRAFPLARQLVRIVRAVIERTMLPVFHAGQHLPRGRPRAGECICDEDAWDVRQTFEELPGELFGCMLVAPPLHPLNPEER